MVQRLILGFFLFASWIFFSGFSLFSTPLQTFSGQIETHDAYLGSKVGGRVEAIDKYEGEWVKKGETLLRFDTKETLATIEMSNAKIESLQASLSKLQNGYTPEEIAMAKAEVEAKHAIMQYALIDFNRKKELLHAKATTPMEFDAAQNHLLETQANYQVALSKWKLFQKGYRQEDIEIQKALLKEAYAQHKLWQIALDEASLKAPEEGRIEKITAQIGDLINKNQIVVQLSFPNTTYAKFYVPETHLDTIHLGQKMKLLIDGSSELFDAEVFYIANSAEFTPKNISTPNDRARLLFAIKAKVTNPMLKSGMFIEVLAP